MARTLSTMIPLGTTAPDFSLPDTVSGNTYSLSDLKGEKATVIMFICNHCPFVIHVNDELIRLANDYQNKGIAFIAISANDAANYPQDSPEKMKQVAEALGYPFPYLYDETQNVAKAYDAACTPDFYIFDKELACAYRGQLDGARPGSPAPNDGKDIRAALEAVLTGNEINPKQIPSMGCNIKWK